jgi:hypothetical protein
VVIRFSLLCLRMTSRMTAKTNERKDEGESALFWKTLQARRPRYPDVPRPPKTVKARRESKTPAATEIRRQLECHRCLRI